ncbi:MAG: alpha/beta hydrolase [Paracoccaceae bacterium]
MDMDRAYANSAFIPGADAMAAGWPVLAAGYRANLGARAVLGVEYGPGARQRFDLFHPEGVAKGLMVFVHGGYWMARDRGDWSHLAAGANARGWAVAMPSYTLAPEARIAAMTGEVARAIEVASGMIGGPVVVTGHSAGGHLAARMGCVDQTVGVARVVPISPLVDLEPVRQAVEMNRTLRLDEAEVATESPARLGLRAGVAAHVWVGGQERPQFLWQARTLSEEWSCPWTVAKGRHHFDVIDDLAEPGSALMGVLLDGV